MEQKQATFTFQVDENLKKTFKKIAKDNNRTASQLMRDWMQEYVKKNGQGKLDI